MHESTPKQSTTLSATRQAFSAIDHGRVITIKRARPSCIVDPLADVYEALALYRTITANMPLPRNEYTGPTDHTVKPSRENLEGKSIIVTGGANGIGEACVREFVSAGSFVTFADMNDRGFALEKELNASRTCCAFVLCDIRSWEDQKAMFETAKKNSPSHSVDVVIANAGISRSSGDSLWQLDGR